MTNDSGKIYWWWCFLFCFYNSVGLSHISILVEAEIMILLYHMTEPHSWIGLQNIFEVLYFSEDSQYCWKSSYKCGIFLSCLQKTFLVRNNFVSLGIFIQVGHLFFSLNLFTFFSEFIIHSNDSKQPNTKKVYSENLLFPHPPFFQSIRYPQNNCRQQFVSF